MLICEKTTGMTVVFSYDPLVLCRGKELTRNQKSINVQKALESQHYMW